jgi:adenine/guanine phosphoribosyltransferase-like PRPP-binding protein
MDKYPQKPKYYENNIVDKPVDIEYILDRVKRATFGIIKQIKERIIAEEYGMVLGIDASGRVPALLIAEVIKTVHHIDVRFVAGNRLTNASTSITQQIEYDLKEYLSSEAFSGVHKMGKKILIVDDTIVTGGSINKICDTLTLLDIKYDIVALNSMLEVQLEGEVPGNIIDKVTSTWNGVSDMYNKQGMSGVVKSKDKIFSTTATNSSTDHKPTKGFIDKKDAMKYTRRRIKDLALEIAKAADLPTKD